MPAMLNRRIKYIKLSEQLSIISLLFFMPLFYSCEEIPPAINMTSEVDTSNNTASKVVLIEEFTGVRCVNCPQGHVKAKEILELHPGSVVVISIHSGFYAEPYTNSKYDFRTSEGSSIETMVGSPIGYPAAMIDRKLFTGETDEILLKDKWSAYVDQQLLLTTPLKIEMTGTWTGSNRNLSVTADLTYNAEATENHYLSVSLTEDSIVDPQNNVTGVDSFYVHNHVLRDMFTPYNGEQVTGTKIAGFVFTKTYNLTLSDTIKENNCHIIGFVHYLGDSSNVIHAAEIKVVP